MRRLMTPFRPWQRWFWPALLLIGLISLVGSAFQRSRPDPAAEPAIFEVRDLFLSAPESTAAGQPVDLFITASAPQQSPILVTLRGAYGTYSTAAALVSNTARVTIPGSATRAAGQAIIAATIGDQVVESPLTITPGPAAEPLRPLVGPGSIPADGRSETMLVVLPFDRFGNPIPEGSPTTFTVQRPDGEIIYYETPVEHLVAWRYYKAGTLAGRTRVSVTTPGAFGSEEALLEIPGWPVNFRVDYAPETLVADGRSLTTLRTGRLHDAFGNLLADGTQVTMVIRDTTGDTSYLPALVIKGQAEVTLIAPEKPDTLQVKAVVFGHESAPLTLTYQAAAAVGHFAIRLVPDEAGTGLAIRAGPLLGQLDQYTPEGQTVEFTITNDSGSGEPLLAAGIVVDGYAEIPLRTADLPPGHYTAAAAVGEARGSTRFSWRVDRPAASVEGEER